MTDVVPAGSFEMPEGLEDLDPSDIGTPRITIDHKAAVFKDGASGEEFAVLENIVLLGVVKQRVLWPATVGAGSEKPLCKSNDSKVGHADMGSFPWDSTAFDLADYLINKDSQDRILLPCADCSLTAWDSHPKRDTPWCSQQNTLVLLMESDGGVYMPALLSLQRSALKPCNNYLGTFMRANKPAFTSYSSIHLEAQRRGDNDFCVPKFVKGGATDPGHYNIYSGQLKSIRRFLTSGNDGTSDDEVGELIGSETPVAAPPPAAPAAPAPAAPAPTPAAPAAPAPTPAPASQAAADDLPF